MKKPLHENVWPYNLLYNIFDMDVSDVRWYDLNDDAPVRLIGMLMPISDMFENGKKGTGERNLRILLQYYQDHMTVKDIAVSNGIHRQTVQNVLDRWMSYFCQPSRKLLLTKLS